MARRRFTILIANRNTGGIRRMTLPLRWLVPAIVAVVTLPALMGLGARWSALAELENLRARSKSLEVENTNYRTATEALTSQIQALQAAVDDLGAQSRLSGPTAKVMDRLPAAVKNRAVGGGRMSALLGHSARFAPSFSSPEDTFGMLRDLLNGVEGYLNIVRKDVEGRQALLAATPAIWPIHGWLSAGYGTRLDPFDGREGFHGGLDISADKGRPVQATADGTVQSASWSGDYGNLVVIKHGFGILTRYGHLSAFAVKPGQKVKRGDLIGLVGATGRATGPHLHYEVAVNGRLLNPLQLLFTKP